MAENGRELKASKQGENLCLTLEPDEGRADKRR
jgi:hypothetical protein